MARKNAGFFDLHAEKLTIGLCALLVIGAAVFSLGGGRFAVNDLGPSELCQRVGAAGDQARQAILGAKPSAASTAGQKDPAKDPVEILKKWYGQSAEGLLKIAGVPPVLERTQPFPPTFISVAGESGEGQRALAQIVAPDIPIVVSDTADLEIPANKPTLAQWDPRSSGGRDVTKVRRPYVSVAAQLDLVKQDANFRTEKYPDGSYLEIVEVRLQRRDLNDPRRGWEDVNTYLPFQSLAKPKLTVKSARSFKFEGFDEFRRLIAAGAEAIARPPLPSKSAKLPLAPFLDEPPKNEEVMPPSEVTREAERRAKAWIDRARAARDGKRPFEKEDLDAAFVLARAAAGTLSAPDKVTSEAKKLLDQIIRKMPKDRRDLVNSNPRPADRMMPIVAHDIEAMPGHTYVYRMKYEILNVYAGNPAELANLEDAKALTVSSDWSPESRPVEIVSDTYFYLTKADSKKGNVTFTVFKTTRRGTIDKKDYRVSVGEEIGRKERRGSKGDFSTGMVCIDIDFSRLIDGKKDVSVVFMDPADGSLQERILSIDRRDPNYEKLIGRRSASK